MKGLHIVSTGKALPKQQVSNDDMRKFVDTSDEWIQSRTGIKTRYFSAGEKNYELATRAARAAMKKGKIYPEEIGAIVIATMTPDYIMPSTACMVQKELGLDEEVMAFDINAACSGFLYGLKICKGLLDSIEKKYVLLIGSEQMSRILDFSDRSTCVLFGDGAGAAIVEASDEHTYLGKSWSRGDRDALFCPGVGNEVGKEEATEISKVSMEGSAVFRFAVSAMKDGIDWILEKEGIEIEDVDYILCHQANARILSHVQKKYKIPKEKVFMNLQHYANTSAASIPIALDEMLEEGLIKEGMKIISVGFGGGFTWAAALLTF